MSIKPKKELAVGAAIELAPQYAEFLFSSRNSGTRIRFSAEINALQQNLGSYVLNYDSEVKIGCALFLCLFGEAGFKEFCGEISLASQEKQQEMLDEMAAMDSSEIDEALSLFEIPRTLDEWAAARAALDALSADDRKEAERRSVFFWSFFFCFFLTRWH